MNNDLRRLPSLDPLKGFDAAARHLSFTKAAAELFLSQSAISRQIQTLEEQLGVKLFRRDVRRLSLTPEGEVLQRTVVEVLARLEDACAGLRASQRRPRVNVSAAVGIASLWLVPRLAAFQEAEPDVDVRLSADNRMVNMEREDIDLALRYVSPDEAPAGSSLLFEEEVFPIAAPQIAARLPAVLRAEDLAKLTLLAYDDGRKAPWLSWEPWLVGLGLTHARPKAVLQFNQYDQLIRAAEDGRGIALGRGPLVGQLIAAGKLKPLGGARQRVATRAYFLVRAQRTARPEVDRFASWLLAEAKETEREAGA
ncbi:MAG: LysR family transcriptional regulator [Rhodocyclaceae bacterium]|jgi:DNA-binding transcriptional LysR family regulator|nr:LysR family transcriptional regulator [Rhodocyclaceae bacterium]